MRRRCWEVSWECPRLAYPWRESEGEDSLVMDTDDLMKGGQVESDVSIQERIPNAC
jgi:hypothetical protein